MRTTIFFGALAVCALLASTAAAEERLIWSEDGPQDPLLIEGWVHELGNLPPFPPEEWIDSIWWQTDYAPCPPSDDPSVPNVVVEIINMTGRHWWDVHYVSDPDTRLTNHDGWIDEVPFPIDLDEEAFRIDWVGLNTPLIFESMTVDTVFEPGEIWHFVIQDYFSLWGGPPSALDSIGVASASPAGPPSTGSIIAIPEPGTLLMLVTAGLLMANRRR